MLPKMKLFHDDVRASIKGKRMRLVVHNEIQQIKINYLKDKNNAEMFTWNVQKAFVAKQITRELKNRTSKMNAQKLKINPNKMIQN